MCCVSYIRGKRSAQKTEKQKENIQIRFTHQNFQYVDREFFFIIIIEFCMEQHTI